MNAVRRLSSPQTSSSPPVEASNASKAPLIKHPTPTTEQMNQANGPPRGDPAVPPEEQKSKPAALLEVLLEPATGISLHAKPPSSPRGDPAFRVEQEMKGRRPKRPPFNQIRLPLQARAGNRPTN